MTENTDMMYNVSPAPHISCKKSVDKIMYIVILAVLFPTAGAVYFFGVYVIFIILVAIFSALITEYLIKKLRKKEFHMDGSAILTGLLLALVLPPTIPLWAVVIGSSFSIAIAKEAFGGLGQNIFNTALAGRAFLSVSFAGLMSQWILPLSSAGDAVTSATPLSESFVFLGPKTELYQALFFGNVGGSLGETSALLILIGGSILLVLKIINWRIPLFYIGTVFILTFILGKDPLFHILAGGLMFGAFFMATDYVTIPLTNKGKILFAIGAGVLVVSFRPYGSMPEGVCFSILIMNSFTPLMDR